MIADVVAAMVPRLEALLGRESVSVADTDRYAVDGVVPRVMARPGDAEQVAAVLRLCAEGGAAVVPWGGGTAIEVGNPPRAADVVLRTDRLAAVIEHDHANLTVTVQAGMSLGALDRALAAQRQFLPLEPPAAELATAGGAIAVNLNGPRRARYGSARDFVIGIRTAQTDGAVVKAGGKTVKNVAGYDMGRLYVGSLGTLAIITEITFKLTPRPEMSRTIAVWSADAPRVMALAEQIFASVLVPSAVVFVNRAAAHRLGATTAGLLVRAEGVEPSVARHERDIAAWAAGTASEVHVIEGEREVSLWTAVRDFAWRDAAAVRLSVRPGRTKALVEGLGAQLPAASAAIADMATGTLWAALETADEVAPALTAMEAALARLGGHLLLARAPRSVKAGRDVWAPLPDPRVLDVMRALKRAFDPRATLNPGRYIAGL
ncbi:MAG: FAD-binding oxidoreductase [Armatimonadota bacterium]|nr:FAD-binding oxidoreductase [Armatimonadota bacterium]